MWINVFTADPLRDVHLSVRWLEGRAELASKPANVDEGVRIAAGDESVGVMSTPHIDPGERGWQRRFLSTGAGSPIVEIRWRDRWGDEWWMTPGNAPQLSTQVYGKSLPAVE